MNYNRFRSDKPNFGSILAIVVTLTYVSHLGVVDVSSQSMPIINNTSAQEHAEHTFDNLIVSEHIPLDGQLINGDYILLMDLTPFATSIEGHSHVAMKVPCNEIGSPKVALITGIAPNLKTLDIGNAINNGTLNGENLDLSAEGRSCLYHAELPRGITNIALVNTSNGTLNFNEGGKYSVTVSIHGTAIQHIGSNQTGTSSS